MRCREKSWALVRADAATCADNAESARSCVSARRNLSAFPTGVTSPSRPGRMTSSTPGRAAVTIGNPVAMASINARPRASERLGNANTSAAANKRGTSRRKPVRTTWRATPWRRASASRRSRRGPSPTITSDRFGSARRIGAAAAKRVKWPLSSTRRATVRRRRLRSPSPNSARTERRADLRLRLCVFRSIPLGMTEIEFTEVFRAAARRRRLWSEIATHCCRRPRMKW